jgi:hypothetical protein
MDVNKLKRLGELFEKGILNEEEFKLEKSKILSANSEQAIQSDTTRISIAGQNLLNIFYALIFLCVYTFVAVIVLFINYSYKSDIFLISLVIQFIVFIIIFSNIYLAGKNLKYSVTTLLDKKRVSVSDKIENDEFLEYLKKKAGTVITETVQVENQCPACNFDISELNTNNPLSECPNCGLNFN